ncbi:MAG: extracellular solute-binding protein [Bacteroidota bacterium]
MYRLPLLLLCAGLLALSACQPPAEPSVSDAAPVVDADGPLVIYSGRSQSLIEPIVERFTADTGIEVQTRFGGTAEMAAALAEEGAQSPADLFWAQDAGGLGAVANLLAELPDSLLAMVPERYQSDDDTWLAVSGRARVLAYSPARADTASLPTSVLDLTDARFEGRVGWAPTNGSFQSFVTAMRQTLGDDSTRAWLDAMDDNGAVAYPRNSAIIEAIANGEVDYGLPNHYYLLRYQSEDPNYPVAQTNFADGDVGNLVNIAGLGKLASSERPNAAATFIAYLLSDEAQAFFAEGTKEYSVTGGGTPDAVLGAAPAIDLNALADLEATLDLLRDAGLL